MDISAIEKIRKKIDYQAIIDAGEDFIDEDFKPEQTSIINETNSALDADETEKYKAYVFKKPDEVFKDEEVNLIADVMEPSDIQQGALGDCYFLSAIASVAEHQSRIKEVFVVKDTNKAGCYVVKMCIGGEFHDIVVDHQMPSLEDATNFAFSRSHGNEIWV